MRRMSQTARMLRPMRRSISMERPLRPLYSRGVRWLVEAGSIAYSAVLQPAPASLRQRGTPSSIVALQSTLVLPNCARHEPSAFIITPGVSVTGRISSAARPKPRPLFSPVIPTPFVP